MMERIDRYIHEVCSKFDESDEEIESLKEEMKAHLYEEVEELKKRGFSEEESIEKALRYFGKENNVVKEINTVWEKKNEFSIIIVKAAVVTFFIGCLFMAVSMLYKSSNVAYVNSNSEHMINTLFKEKISKGNLQKDEVDKALNQFNNKNQNGLYYVKIEKMNSLKYEYKKNTALGSTECDYTGKLIKDYWSIYYKKTDLQQEKDMENLYKLTQLNNNPVNLIFEKITDVLFIISFFILSMAGYIYIGRRSKIVFAIAVLDFAISGWLIAAMCFPNSIKIGTVFIWGSCLLTFTMFKIYFIRKKVSYKKA